MWIQKTATSKEIYHTCYILIDDISIENYKPGTHCCVSYTNKYYNKKITFN